MANNDEMCNPLVEAWEAYRLQPRSYAERCEWADVYDWVQDENIAPDFIAFYAVMQYQEKMLKLHKLAEKSAVKKTAAAKVVH